MQTQLALHHYACVLQSKAFLALALAASVRHTSPARRSSASRSVDSRTLDGTSVYTDDVSEREFDDGFSDDGGGGVVIDDDSAIVVDVLGNLSVQLSPTARGRPRPHTSPSKVKSAWE